MRAQLYRGFLVFMCVCACFRSTQALGNPCCCYGEEEKFGFWPSRGPGGRAFIIGATITAAGIAGIIVASNNRSRHSSSSKSKQNNGNDDGFNPNLNPNAGGTPAAAVTNFANQAVNNTDVIAGIGVPLEINTSTINPINTITTQGGATQSIRSKQKSFKRKPSVHSQNSSPLVMDDNQVRIDFKVKLSGSHFGSIGLIPFVVFPDGKVLEGSPFITKANGHSDTAPITFKPSNRGAHKVGLRVTSANANVPINIHLECAISHSGNQSTQVVGASGSHLEKQIASEFSL